MYQAIVVDADDITNHWRTGTATSVVGDSLTYIKAPL